MLETSHDDATICQERMVLPASQMERCIGKPAESWTVDDLIDVVRDQSIRLVSLMHVGGDSRLKSVDFVPRDTNHLRDVLIAGERADGSSLFGAMGIRSGRSDIVLRPRISTAFLQPFTEIPTLAVLCRHLGRDGTPLPESPDTIVNKAFDRARQVTGVELHGHAEVEYFLGRAPQQADIYSKADHGYHASSPFVFGETIRRQAMVVLSEIGVPIKYAHSEVGYVKPDEMSDFVWEQHELELALQPLPRAVESNTLTVWVLRNLANRAGARLSLDPVVRSGHAGNGLHYHLSPVINGENGSVINDDGSLTPEAKWLIGGLATIGGALMAFGNRKISSFLRLAQGKEAPNTITWGQFNRKVLIRLPIIVTNPSGEIVSPPTVEFRLPDGSAHPHVLLAGIAQALVVGHEIDNLDELVNRTRAETVGENPDGATPVPRSLAEVSSQLQRHRALLEAGDVFPSHSLDRLIKALRLGRL